MATVGSIASYEDNEEIDDSNMEFEKFIVACCVVYGL
jgi:hypothetical protein